MKSEAKRRRTKEEIRQQKLEEEIKQREIAAKLERFEQMQAQIDQLSQSQSMISEATNVLNILSQEGLIRRDNDGDWNPVRSLEEQRQVLGQREEEQKLGE